MTEDAIPEDSVLGDNRDGTPSMMSARQVTNHCRIRRSFSYSMGCMMTLRGQLPPLFLQRELQNSR